MRTNVVINDELMECALNLSGLKTKKDAIEEGGVTPVLWTVNGLRFH